MSPNWQKSLKTPKHQNMDFALMYANLPVGVLTLNEGLWEFNYTSQFKYQTKVKPLSDFPDVNKVYQANTLWPFFSVRIPNTSRPSVKKIINEEKIQPDNIADLLKRFGKETISNPFTLHAA